MTGARPRTVYAVTARGRKALRRWLDEPPAPPTLEFEGMVKVFFADGGTLEQLRTTLTSIAETADGRVAELEAKVEENARGDVPFPERLPLNTIGLRFHARPRAADRRLGALGARPDRRVALAHRPGLVGLPPALAVSVLHRVTPAGEERSERAIRDVLHEGRHRTFRDDVLEEAQLTA